jgi:hypothetical protein
MKTKAIIIGFVSALTFVSCVDKIDLKLDKQDYEKIVVEGMITDEMKNHTVKISKTVDYSNQSALPVVSKAEVSITCDDSTILLTEVKPGLYQTPVMAGEIGKTYKLKIHYNNYDYTAQSTMKPTFTADSISVNYFAMSNKKEPMAEIKISGQESPEPNEFYLVKLRRNGHVVDSLDKWGIVSDYMVNGKYLKSETTLVTPLSKNDTVSLEFYSVDESFFYFINQCKQTSQPAMFFNPPPANIKGNISDKILGFFQASAVKTSETCVYSGNK